MSKKLVIAKVGYEYTDTDPTHLIFSTDYNSTKTALYGNLQRTLTAGATTTVSISHGLGIFPLVLAYFADTADNRYRIVMSDPENGLRPRVNCNVNVAVNVTATVVNFIFKNYDFSNSRTINLYYEIFYEGV